MAEFASIAAGLSTIKSAIDIAKGLKEVDRAWELAEFKLKMVELIDKLVESKSFLIEAKEENETLRNVAEQAIRIAEKNLSLEYNGWLYVDKKDSSQFNQYCPRCWDVDKKSVRLIGHSSGNGYECKGCKEHFYPPERRGPRSW